MKVMTIKSPGGLHNLHLVDREPARPGRGEVLIRVRAVALNYHDYVVANGRVPVADGRIPMSDAAGEVVEVGDGVIEFRAGDPIVSVFYPMWPSGDPEPISRTVIPGETTNGYGAELVVVPELWVTRAPTGYTPVEAATLTCAGLTAWRGVVTAGRVQPGDTVLVQGTGGVSIFALQFAKAAGATVIATSSSEDKLERLRGLGADHVINYRTTPKWGEAVQDLTAGRGADLVVEIGGAGTLHQSITACRIGGRISLIGALAGARGEAPTATIFLKQITILGLAVGSRSDQLAMIRGVEANRLKPVIDSVYPLEELGEAYRRQEAQKHFGKICAEV
jgi:NADPH:quinone reductase-like Zn-dependent oxidoreductase